MQRPRVVQHATSTWHTADVLFGRDAVLREAHHPSDDRAALRKRPSCVPRARLWPLFPPV